MNIIDVIDRNHFLKNLYPNGLNNCFVGAIKLRINDFGNSSMMIHTRTSPSIAVSKWGQWGINYNALAFEVTMDIIERANILNWENAVGKECNCEVFELENRIHLNFSGKDWSIHLIVVGLTFQQAHPYWINDEKV